MLNLQGISGFFYAGFLLEPRCFSLCFEGLGLVNIDPRHQPVKLPPGKIPDHIDPRHQPVKLPPGKIPDLRLLPGPLIAAADRQPLVDQNEAVRFLSEYSDKKSYPQPFVIRIFLPFILRYARFPEKNMRIKIYDVSSF